VLQRQSLGNVDEVLGRMRVVDELPIAESELVIFFKESHELTSDGYRSGLKVKSESCIRIHKIMAGSAVPGTGCVTVNFL
jgi:hypothetical protein